MNRALCLLVAALASACSPPPTVEQQVVAEIREMEEAIEGGERLNFIGRVADDFRGQGGAMNRDQLRAYIVLQSGRYKEIEARIFPITVREISEVEASAEFRALLTGGSGWIPEDGRLYRIETLWRLEGDDWLLTAARWEPTGFGDAP